MKEIKENFDKHGNKGQALTEVGGEVMKNIGEGLKMFFNS